MFLMRVLAAMMVSAPMCVPVPALASEADGRVLDLHVRSTDGLQYVVIDGATTSRPACATIRSYFMIKDEHSDAGKAQLAMLLSAKLSQHTVRVIGTGECTRWLDGEDIAEIMILPG